jgi:hypothetical protein
VLSLILTVSKADLGNHRHTDLPLSGPVNLEAPPAPNAKKFGVSAARIAAKNDDIASAWGGWLSFFLYIVLSFANSLVTAVYDPELDEDRDDGLGTGQAHRLGFNFRPNQNVLSGRGRGRRTRSMSPRGRFGRGRGLVEPGMLGIHMGTRPPKLPSTHRFVATAGDPSIRHVRPRVSTHAMDDMAAPSSSYHGGGGINAPPPPKPTRAPIHVDVKDVHVGQYVHPTA